MEIDRGGEIELLVSLLIWGLVCSQLQGSFLHLAEVVSLHAWVRHKSSVGVSGGTKSLAKVLENLKVERAKSTATLSSHWKIPKTDNTGLEQDCVPSVWVTGAKEIMAAWPTPKKMVSLEQLWKYRALPVISALINRVPWLLFQVENLCKGYWLEKCFSWDLSCCKVSVH